MRGAEGSGKRPRGSGEPSAGAKSCPLPRFPDSATSSRWAAGHELPALKYFSIRGYNFQEKLAGSVHAWRYVRTYVRTLGDEYPASSSPHGSKSSST